MAMAATTGRAIALPAGWRSIAPAGAKGRIKSRTRRCGLSPSVAALAFEQD
jgi:hypothetical protein